MIKEVAKLIVIAVMSGILLFLLQIIQAHQVWAVSVVVIAACVVYRSFSGSMRAGISVRDSGLFSIKRY